MRLQIFMFSQQRLSCIAERAPCGPTIQLYSSAICDHADFRLHMEIGSDFLFSIISCLFISDIKIFRSSKLYVLRVPLKDADAILSSDAMKHERSIVSLLRALLNLIQIDLR